MSEYLYVCHFSNGHIKVGRSVYPKSRIAQHADRVACIGIELIEHHIAECIGHSEPAETSLINRCAELATKRHGSEWFAGLDYPMVCELADHIARIVFDPVKPKAAREIKESEALDQAIAIAGGISALYRALGLSGHAVIQQWKRNRVPAEKCPDIEALTGIKCEDLRPDVNWAVLRNQTTKAA